MMKDFVVRDQSLMDEAVNYNQWLYSLAAPYLRGDTLEIGSGIGNITMSILNRPRKVRSLTCVDVNENCCSYLRRQSAKVQYSIGLKIINADFMNLNEGMRFDTIFNFNVLEHLENDIGALSKMKGLLNPGGTIIGFVPALKYLYGSIDRNLSHFRRYSRKELSDKLSAVGMNIVRLRYYNSVGVLGWFLNNRVARIKSQSQQQIAVFDRLILPFQSRVESLIEMPFGQNLFFIAQKE